MFEKEEGKPKQAQEPSFQPSSTGPPLPLGPLALFFPWADPHFPWATPTSPAQSSFPLFRGPVPLPPSARSPARVKRVPPPTSRTHGSVPSLSSARNLRACSSVSLPPCSPAALLTVLPEPLGQETHRRTARLRSLRTQHGHRAPRTDFGSARESVARLRACRDFRWPAHRGSLPALFERSPRPLPGIPSAGPPSNPTSAAESSAPEPSSAPPWTSRPAAPPCPQSYTAAPDRAPGLLRARSRRPQHLQQPPPREQRQPRRQTTTSVPRTASLREIQAPVSFAFPCPSFWTRNRSG